ncbi:MAG: GYF domain-containing protein [Verrucomicrobiota bacterium]
MWYYAINQQQQGPISDAELESLFKSGAITSETLIWQTGMAAWLPYGQVKPVTPPSGIPTPVSGGGLVCSMCKQAFPPDQVLRLGESWVCGTCKPLYVQRLREGGSGSGHAGRRALPVNPDDLIREIAQRDYELLSVECIRRGWDLVVRNAGLCIGVTVLAMLVMSGGGIPIVGPIVSLIVTGPMLGGLYCFYLKLIRSETAMVSDAFSGFKTAFGRLLAGNLFSKLLLILWLAPGGILFAIMGNKGMVPGVILLSLAMIPIIYLSVCFVFIMPLIADLELSAWDAIRVSRAVVNQHWGSVLVLCFLGGLVAGVGVLACCVGLLFTLPVFYASLAYAYEDIFGLKETR